MSTISMTGSMPMRVFASVQSASASARSQATTAGDSESVAGDYAAWRDTLKTQDMEATYVAKIDTARDRFVAIAQDARDNGGLDDPQAYLKSLGKDDLAALQATHGLADPIKPAALSREGAYNLLMVRGQEQEQDLDHDGLTEVGLARTIVFPPRDAPQSVKAAWDAAIEGLDAGTKAIMTLSAWSGARGGLLHEGTADYAKDGFDWKELAAKMISGGHENLKYQTTPEQRDRILAQIDAYRDFQSQLG